MKRSKMAVFFSGCCAVALTMGAPAECADRGGKKPELRVEKRDDRIVVFRAGMKRPLLVQNAREDFRPYLHPLATPDGKGVLTEYSPTHHKHQTGLYWGPTRVGGRDYFHHPEGDYWRLRGTRVLGAKGNVARWEVEYDLLRKDGQALLGQKHSWTLTDHGDYYVLDLQRVATAQQDVAFGRYDYGGMFLRMPWRPETGGTASLAAGGTATNSRYQHNAAAEGQRARWVDVGMPIEGCDGLGHVVLMDHPENEGYPLPWRVDGQLGVGPCRERLGDWKLQRGQSDRVRRRVLVYMGEFDGRHVEAIWHEFAGKSLENIHPGPEVAPAAMTAAPGFHVSLAAGEPDVVQPFAFCFDDRGRIWLAENLNYATRGEHISEPRGRIIILEDTDGDGRFEDRKVFIENLFFPTGLEIGFGGVWVGSPPNLLFIPDRNGDDVPDGPAEVILDGWGIQDRHETLNSFIWGPDGWLYGCQGFATHSRVGKPHARNQDRISFSAGWWRYHPLKKRFELFAEGGSNQWGLDFDDHGQMISTACVIPHLWHPVQGAYTQRQGGRHRNGHTYADIQTIADHVHWEVPGGREGGFAHGGCRVYLADQFPPEHRGDVVMGNIHHHGLYIDLLKRQGSGFVGSHGGDFFMANDPQFLGFNIEVGPEGAVYVIDWHDGDICGREVKHGQTGRVYRVSYGQVGTATGLDLARLPDAELVKLQQHANDWYVRHARRILQQRAAAGKLSPAVGAALKKLFDQTPSAAGKLRALWALHVAGGADGAFLTPLLDHPSEYVRAWAVQLLCEDQDPPGPAIERFAALARHDPSPVVRLYLASALQRIPLEKRWPVAEGLVTHAEDVDDHNLPLMIWYGIEPLVPADAARAMRLAAASKIPLIRQHIARRITSK